jgi:hypothetical protein
MAGVLASVSTSDAEGLVPRKRWTISPRLTDEISAALAHVAPKMDNHPPREVNTGKNRRSSWSHRARGHFATAGYGQAVDYL